MAGTLDSLFGGIKSIQRGSATITSALSINVTISAVDLNKAVVIGGGGQFNSANNGTGGLPYAQLTTSTNLLVKRFDSVGGSSNFEWQVVESN